MAKQTARTQSAPVYSVALTPEIRSSWLTKVQSMQRSNVTPEMRERISRKAKMVQSASRSARRCKKMQKASRITKSALSRGIRSISASATPQLALQASNTVQAQWSMVSSALADDAEEDQRSRAQDAASFSFGAAASGPPIPGVGAAPRAPFAACAPVLALAASEEAEDVYDALALVVGDASAADVSIARAAPGAAVSENTSMLAMLKKEPTDDTDMAAKFGLYEKYLETVVTCRKTTLDFWAESKADFTAEDEATPAAPAGAAAPPPAPAPAPAFGAARVPVAGAPGGAAASIEAALKHLDRPGAMGIDFEGLGGRWYVHDMAQKACSNNDALERIQDTMRNKLELLAQQLECPVCLEPFLLPAEEEEEDSLDDAAEESEEECLLRPALVLSCCHKVCDVCWANWSATCADMTRAPFCPLCNQDQFIAAILPEDVAAP